MVDRFEQFYGSIAAIHRSIVKIERTEMAKYGLKGPHANCLLALERYPEGITSARLCEICEKDKAAISRTLGELEAEGLVCREQAEGKRYRANIRLTEQGEEIAKGVKNLVHLAVSKASEGYDPENRQTFVRVLNLLADNLQNMCVKGI